MLNLDKSTWNRVRLGDVVQPSKEKVDPTSGEVERYIAGEHMDSDDLKIHRWGEVGDKDLGPAFHRRFRAGQVLYGSRRTYLRKVAVAEFDGVCANTTFVLETAENSGLLQEFLPFVMTSEHFHAFAIGESKGSVNPYVNWSDIAKFEFDLPPLEEQKRITELLWAVEQHARSTSRFRDLLRESLSDWIDRQISCSNWHEVPVETLLLSGPTNGISARANDQQLGVPTLSISAVRNGRLNRKDSIKYVDVSLERATNYVIKDGDVFAVRGNGNRGLVARCGIADGDLPDGCIFPDLLIRMRFNRKLILPSFAVTQWNSTSTHNSLVRKAKSTNGTWKVNGKDIRSHTLRVPSINIQKSFMLEVGRLESGVSALERETATLTGLRSSLLFSIFGES